MKQFIHALVGTMVTVICATTVADEMATRQWLKKVEAIVYEDQGNNTHISFISSKTSDFGDTDLARLKVLKSLHLHDTKISDAGLAHLKELKSLTDLSLGETTISDRGLTQVKQLTSLTKLHLRGTRITDAGLTHLKTLKALRHLDISFTKVTDAGLIHLENLKALRHLELGGLSTEITAEGLKSLQDALPKCKIEMTRRLKNPFDVP